VIDIYSPTGMVEVRGCVRYHRFPGRMPGQTRGVKRIMELFWTILFLACVTLVGWTFVQGVMGFARDLRALDRHGRESARRSARCPHCEERIMPQAKICPHCKSKLIPA
jgi:hypothetical protein